VNGKSASLKRIFISYDLEHFLHHPTENHSTNISLPPSLQLKKGVEIGSHRTLSLKIKNRFGYPMTRRVQQPFGRIFEIRQGPSTLSGPIAAFISLFLHMPGHV